MEVSLQLSPNVPLRLLIVDLNSVNSVINPTLSAIP